MVSHHIYASPEIQRPELSQGNIYKRCALKIIKIRRVNVNLQSGQNIPLQQSAIRLNLQYPTKSGFKGEPDTCLF
ncbi:tellurium resistance protein TerF, partial [Escherichia coli]